MPDFVISLTNPQASFLQWQTDQVNALRVTAGQLPLTVDQVLDFEVSRMLRAWRDLRAKNLQETRGNAYLLSDPTVQSQVDTLLNLPPSP